MEQMSQQEKEELEYQNPNEVQGGIRRRLRDRDLLKKRKAEAEEKETNQWVLGVESQRKRSRAQDKSGTKRRGRPRKTDPMLQISVVQEEAAGTQEGPAVVVVPEPAEVIPDQISDYLTPVITVESQLVPILAAPASAPLLESVQSPVFAPFLTSPAPAAPTPETAPVPVQDSAPDPDAVSAPAPSQDSVPAADPAAPSAPPQVETLYTESQGRQAMDQILIDELGSDEEEDISPSQDKRADEDLRETLSIDMPEQNKIIYSVPTLSSAPLPQEYLPGN
ncbi:uncharacterized protein hemgn isoform X1 [Brachyistius frenatus]|uniref:uncharacterized protein hemgn isoform X1 n=1 Tax=Brachyistius frenatus TaxID=100188 RepID=UPI0037E8EC88